jgi:hypothetical protein
VTEQLAAPLVGAPLPDIPRTWLENQCALRNSGREAL